MDKSAAIAKKVDDLGDQFRPSMRTGWLAYIKKTYSADAVQHGPALGQGREMMMSDCLLVLECFAHYIPNQMAILRFRIITIIVQIIAIIGENWTNWVRIDAVTAALMQSTWA